MQLVSGQMKLRASAPTFILCNQQELWTRTLTWGFISRFQVKGRPVSWRSNFVPQSQELSWQNQRQNDGSALLCLFRARYPFRQITCDLLPSPV